MKKTVGAILISALILLIALMFFGVNEHTPDTPAVYTEGELLVHFLDVGQGDSTFIELPDGKCMLIDASESEYADKIISYIEGRGYTAIDYALATHPHSDHIGGMAEVIDAFDIGAFYMPQKEHTTKTFEKMLLAVEQSGCDAHFVKAGDTLFEGEGFAARVVAPCYDDYEDLNNFSAVVHITYGNTAFLLTGDAEDVSESEILKSGADIRANVLKVGHHGSSSSSTKKFVKAVSPEYAVISCGRDNEYGFPKQAVVKRFKNQGAQVLVTYEEGDIVLASDGEAVGLWNG